MVVVADCLGVLLLVLGGFGVCDDVVDSKSAFGGCEQVGAIGVSGGVY